MPVDDAAASPTSVEFRDELVFVKVEDTVHCVAKSDLTRWGGVFKDMFELPQGSESEGTSEANPIALADCTNAEFEALMEVIAESRPLNGLDMTKGQWISVLKLSTRWDMDKVRVLAIAKLGSLHLTSKEKFQLGSDHRVMSLFVDGCAAFTVREYDSEALNDLAHSLGWDFAARIMWIVTSGGNVLNDQVGFRTDTLKCQQCSAALVVRESSEPVPRAIQVQMNHAPQIAPHPLQYQQPPLLQSQPQQQHQHPQAQAFHAVLNPPIPQPIPNHLQQQLHLTHMQQTAMHYHLGKQSLSLTFRCPTPSCSGVLDASDIRIDASATASRLAEGDVLDFIEKAFSDKMKDMY